MIPRACAFPDVKPHLYLLPVSADLVVELYSNKKHPECPRTDTGYDKSMEAIIATFRSR